MHEMGIALQIIEIATAALPADLAEARIERVNLKIGKFAAVIPDNLRFCFEAAALDTPLAGALLQIEEIPVRVRCRACGRTSTIDTPAFKCQHCPGTALDIISGRELDIESIELAD